MACGSASHDDHDHDHDEDDEHEHSGSVVIEPEKAAEFGILTETLKPAPFHDVIKTSGSIEASGSDIFTVTAKKSGIVTLSPGITQGAEVKNGQTIGSISSGGVQGGDVSKAAAANLEVAKKEYERLKPLYEEKLVTAATFREAERAYREAEALAAGGSGGSAALTATGSGLITNLAVRNGEYVEVGTPVATIAKNSALTLKADIPARYARHIPEITNAHFIPEGSDEVLDLAQLGGRKISGSSVQAAENGYIPLYFSFNSNTLSAPAGYSQVFLICEEKPNVISVPKEAILEIQGNNYVYKAIDDHSYEKRLVKTGATDGIRIEILEGLEEGENIVTKGATVVRMAEVSSVAPPSHNHSH